MCFCYLFQRCIELHELFHEMNSIAVPIYHTVRIRAYGKPKMKGLLTKVVDIEQDLPRHTNDVDMVSTFHMESHI